MSFSFFTTFQFIKYWLYAVGRHSLQSPFAFRFHEEVIKQANKEAISPTTLSLKNAFLKNKKVIRYDDLGGSTGRKERSVRELAQRSTSQLKVMRLIACIARHLEAQYIVELGTSLGINTSNLASKTKSQINTIEGIPEIYDLADEHLSTYGNVRTYLGEIGEVLPRILSEMPHVDLAYMDANHTYKATMNYYELIREKLQPNSVVVVGDIYWSQGMKKAWSELQDQKEVTISMDLFSVGLLFFMPQKHKQKHIIWY